MKMVKIAAAFSACLGTAPTLALAQDASTSFNPATTARTVMDSAEGFHISVREDFANMQQCIADMNAEAQDFQEMRDTDIIGPNDRFAYTCEDEQRIVTATFTRFGGEQRHTHFKP